MCITIQCELLCDLGTQCEHGNIKYQIGFQSDLRLEIIKTLIFYLLFGIQDTLRYDFVCFV